MLMLWRSFFHVIGFPMKMLIVNKKTGISRQNISTICSFKTLRSTNQPRQEPLSLEGQYGGKQCWPHFQSTKHHKNDTKTMMCQGSPSVGLMVYGHRQSSRCQSLHVSPHRDKKGQSYQRALGKGSRVTGWEETSTKTAASMRSGISCAMSLCRDHKLQNSVRKTRKMTCLF